MENIYKEPSKIMKQAMDLYLDGKIDMAENIGDKQTNYMKMRVVNIL